jgi:hypothetical protein
MVMKTYPILFIVVFLLPGIWSCQKAEDLPPLGVNVMDPYPDDYIRVDSFTTRKGTSREVTFHISHNFMSLNEVQKAKVKTILYDLKIENDKRENFLQLNQPSFKVGFRSAGEKITIRFQYSLVDKQTTDYTRYFEYTIP